MGLAQSILPEFDHEMANTRKSLERVPDDRLDWQPHAKSMTLRRLATHIGNLPHWGVMTLQQDSFDMAPPGEEAPRVEPAESTAAALETFDKNVGEARAALEGASDEQLFATWTLLSGGQEVFSLPRVAVFRSFVLNHIIHHRAQLGVYLRMNDVPVPPMYGPTADEDM